VNPAKPEETKKAAEVVVAEEKQASEPKKEDFNNSLAALIGRGKPTYKKKEEAPAEVVEQPKVKMANIFDDEEEKETLPSGSVQDAAFVANQKVTLKSNAGKRKSTKYNLENFNLDE
jgi:hypothetical protein